MALSVFSIIWVKDHFGKVDFEQLIFHLKVPMDGANLDFIWSYIIVCVIPAVIITVMCIVIKVYFNKKSTKFMIPISLFGIVKIALTITFICAIIEMDRYFDISKYIINMHNKNTIYEEYYVDPKEVEVTFPEEKRNLIYIFLESMETSYLSKELGGAQEENLLPNLSKLAQTNTSFSTSDLIQGSYIAPKTGFTVAAMVSQTSGVPLRLPIDGNSYSGYKSFLPGVYSIGDILNEAGYNQMLMVGSYATFGGRKDYFESHGNYQIWDYYTAIDEGKIDSSYFEFWGYEDQKLFEYAKEEITKLAQQDEPFNFTMLTVDTHFPDGYVCDLCGTDHERQYANVIQCSDQQVSNFIEWIQKQSFYENTTIVISGDHISMDANFFQDTPEDYRRATFNTIINSAVTTENTKNRAFTSFDMYPTTLASIGATIDGEKLGLGVNLFSESNTLCEQLGTEYFLSELEKVSTFYNKELLYHK